MIANLQVENRVLMSESRKSWMITLAVLEILLGVGAISACIATLILSNDGRSVIIYSSLSGGVYYNNFYSYYNVLYTLSLTSQGIWAGCFVIIAAIANIKMAKQPTTITKSYSTGFSSWSMVLTVAMVALEATAVRWGMNAGTALPNWFALYDLHIALLSTALILTILIISSLILSATVYDGASGGGCCGCNSAQAVYPGIVEYVDDGNRLIRQMPMPITTAFDPRMVSKPPTIPTTPYYTVPVNLQQQSAPVVLQQPYSLNSHVSTQVSNDVVPTNRSLEIADGFRKVNSSATSS